jgi:hypothetical protein
MADGNEVPWTDSLPDDLKADPNVIKFKTPAEMAKGYVEASKLIGSSIRPPGPDASAEAKKDFREKMQKADPDLIFAGEGADEAPFWKRLGKPDKEDGYSVDEETGKAIDLAAARKQALEAGLTVKQFQTLAKQTAAAKAEVAAQTKAASDALKSEWGAAYSERLVLAAAAAAKLGLTDAQVAGIVAGSAPPDQLKFLHSVAVAVGTNPKELNNQKDGGSGAMTPHDAEMAISEIMNNKAHPYWNPRDPANAAAIAKMQKLVGMADPSLTARSG